MAAMMQSLGIDQMSREERWQLVEELFQSLLDDPKEFLSSEQRDELEECLNDYRRNPGAGAPWKDVMDRIDHSE